MHLFHLLFKDVKIFSICHRVLGVPTVIWPFLGLQKQLHSLSQLHMLVIYLFIYFFESMFIVLWGRASRWTLHSTILCLLAPNARFRLYFSGRPQLLCVAHPWWSLPMQNQHRNTVFRCTIIRICASAVQSGWLYHKAFFMCFLLCTPDCLCNRHNWVSGNWGLRVLQ